MSSAAVVIGALRVRNPVLLLVMDLDSRVREKNAGILDEMPPTVIEQFVEGPYNQ